MKHENRKAMLPVLIALSMSFIPASAVAREGTRGGAKVRRHADGYRLLEDPTACQWEDGSVVLGKNPEVSRILTSVARMNWYFAFDLERRVRRSSFCFTEQLIPVDVTDDPACRVTREQGNAPGFVQGATFAGDLGIFIDRNIARQMTPRRRAEMILHEILHTVVAWDCRHNTNLRSVETMIRSIGLGLPISRARFETTLRQSRVQFPDYSERVQSQRAYLGFVLGEPALVRKQLLRSSDPEAFLAARPIDGNLLEEDRQRLDALQSDHYGNLLQPYCDARDREIISFLANHPGVRSFDTAGICLERLTDEDASPDFRRFLLAGVHVEEQMGALLDRLAAKRISSEEGRLMVTSTISDLTVTPVDSRPSRPIIELRPVHPSTWESLPANIRTISMLLAQLVDAGQLERVARMTIRDPRFYPAFSITRAQRSLESLPVLVSRERALAQTALRLAFERFLTGLLARLGQPAAETLSQEIDWDRLGYGTDTTQASTDMNNEKE